MAQHLEVLLLLARRLIRSVQCVGEAHPIQGTLRVTANGLQHLHVEAFEQGWHEVHDVVELVANNPSIANSVGPMDNQR